MECEVEHLIQERNQKVKELILNGSVEILFESLSARL